MNRECESCGKFYPTGEIPIGDAECPKCRTKRHERECCVRCDRCEVLLAADGACDECCERYEEAISRGDSNLCDCCAGDLGTRR